MAFGQIEQVGRDYAQRELAKGGNRQVFSGGMVPHVWAAQTQESARSTNGNVYFDGPTLFSYGSHFPLGVIVGQTAFLNSDKYSVSTSGHQTAAAVATRHMTQVHLPAMKEIHYELRDLSRLLKAKQKGKPVATRADPEGLKAAALRYLEKCGAQFANGDWNSPPDSDAITFGAAFGITEAAVKRTLAKSRKAAADKAADDKAAEKRADLREARQVAELDSERFQVWRSRFVQNYGNVESREKSAAQFATRIRRMIKVLRDAKAAAKTIDAMKAKLALSLELGAAIRPAMIKEHRKDQARGLRNYRADWRAAVASGDQTRMVLIADKIYHVDILNARRFVLDNEPERLLLAPGKRALAHYAARVVRTVEPFVAQVRADQKALREAEKLESQRKEVERKAAALATWLAGGVAIPPREMPGGGVYLRRKDGELQTSMGVGVPWEHAVKAFRFIKLCKERGQSFHTNGRTIRVGHFTVTEITSEGNMTAGCHTFQWAEIERLAKDQGVFDLAPDDSAIVASH